MDKVKADLATERAAQESAEKKTSDAEQKLKEHIYSLPGLKEEWITKCINSRTHEVLEKLTREFQDGYNFALNKSISLPTTSLGYKLGGLRNLKLRRRKLTPKRGPKKMKRRLTSLQKSLRLKFKFKLALKFKLINGLFLLLKLNFFAL